MGASPVAAPAVFGLRKHWVDPVPGIAMVQLHYVTSAPGEEPGWGAADQVVLVPSGDALRTAVLEVPRAGLLLHHFFFVVAAERAWSPVFTEQIVAREVAYEDRGGDHTSAGLVWSAVGADAPNYSATTMDGLPSGSPDEVPADAGRYDLVRAQPLPHVFRGLVWGVRGTRVRYGWHLLRQGLPDPDGDAETWDDDAGRGWTVDL